VETSFVLLNVLVGVGLGLCLARLPRHGWLLGYVPPLVVGDPTSGLNRLSHKEFNDRWRHIGVVLTR
jgi:hypothetical protein